MEISHILTNEQPLGRTKLFSSIIEPEQTQKINQNQFIIKKVALAQKIVIKDYLFRENISHPNTPTLKIVNNSKFYLTIHIEKIQPFFIKQLLTMNVTARNKLLIDILKTISFLSLHYGFFYVAEKMLGYSSKGKIKVWINDNFFKNNRKRPIDHGKISQEIFIFDFKEQFFENSRNMNQFYSIKSIDSLINLLSNQSIFQSAHISQPPNTNSLILRNKGITTSFDDYLFSKIPNQNEFNREVVSPPDHSLNSVLKRRISISYIPIQGSQILNQSPKKLIRTISNPSNRGSFATQSNLSFNQLYSTKQSLISSSSCKNLARTSTLNQSTAKIQFNYALHKQAWKKKKQDQDSKKNRISSYRKNLKRTTPLIRNTQQQLSPLKVSFPYTTTHTFTPFASNGNINLHFNENISQRKQGKQGIFSKQDEVKQNGALQPHISEQSNEVQMDLDCLFSDAGNDLQSQEQIEILQFLAQEFENILQG